MAHFRISAHNLHIEAGRYNNTELQLRSCHICKTDVIEDEVHFLTQCLAYNVARYSLFQKIEPFQSAEIPDVVKATAHFLHESFRLRNDILGIR